MLRLCFDTQTADKANDIVIENEILKVFDVK